MLYAFLIPSRWGRVGVCLFFVCLFLISFFFFFECGGVVCFRRWNYHESLWKGNSPPYLNGFYYFPGFEKEENVILRRNISSGRRYRSLGQRSQNWQGDPDTLSQTYRGTWRCPRC